MRLYHMQLTGTMRRARPRQSLHIRLHAGPTLHGDDAPRPQSTQLHAYGTGTMRRARSLLFMYHHIPSPAHPPPVITLACMRRDADLTQRPAPGTFRLVGVLLPVESRLGPHRSRSSA